MPDYARIYAKQEYLTPGAIETVRIVGERVLPGERTRLLDVASGKGEAAATLSSQFGCRIVAVEPYDAFVQVSTAKVSFLNVRDLVNIVRADGQHLPLTDMSMDAAYCIGGPSIVGLESALLEMARVVLPGGHVIVSDIIWRTKPGALDAKEWEEWDWIAGARQITAEEYAAVIGRMGLRLEQTHIHERSAWEEYFRPMLAVAREAKSDLSGDVRFADALQAKIDLERRAVEAWLDYATFVATKPQQRAR